MGNEISNAAATDASASSSRRNASFQVCSHCAAIITAPPPQRSPQCWRWRKPAPRAAIAAELSAAQAVSQMRQFILCSMCQQRCPENQPRPPLNQLAIELSTGAAVAHAAAGLHQQYRRRWRCAANPLCRFKHRGVAGSGAGSHAGGRAVRDRTVRTAAGKHARRTGAGARALRAAAITGDISDAQAVNDALKDEDAEDSIAAVPVRRPLRHGTSSGAPAVPGAAATATPQPRGQGAKSGLAMAAVVGPGVSRI